MSFIMGVFSAVGSWLSQRCRSTIQSHVLRAEISVSNDNPNSPDPRPPAGPGGEPSDDANEPVRGVAVDAPPADPSSGFGMSVSVVVSWMVIVGLTLFLAGNVLLQQLSPPVQQEFLATDVMNVALFGKIALGQSKLAPNDKQALIDQMAQFKSGSVEQRWGYAILLNELEGPEAALEQMEVIDQAIQEHEYQLSETQQRVRELLMRLFRQYASGDFDSSDLADEDREFLRQKLGWLGELALYPPETPNKPQREAVEASGIYALIIVGMACMLGLAMVVGGLVAIGLFIYWFASGRFQTWFPPLRGRAAIYVETFAIWMASFVALQFGLSVLAVMSERMDVIKWLVPAAFFGSLVVLAWPVIRGVPWSEVRDDIGWRIGNPFKEVAAGLATYCAMIPALMIAAVISILIAGGMSLFQEPTEFGGAPAGGHPIQEDIAQGDPVIWLYVLVTACVAAPIVEETMFRGVLYRHLREMTGRWHRPASVAISALVNSLVFASIHPQGIIGIPLLATLAIGFSLAREWRGSLVGPMAMHAINNGIVTTLLLSLMAV